jgi:hypothetical protein
VLSCARWLSVFLLLQVACGREASPASPGLRSFTERTERCVERSSSRADSAVAQCVCQSYGGHAASQAIRCFATPYLLGFIGDSVPLPSIRRSRDSYYGLAFAPRGLDLSVTEQREVFTYGYGVVLARADLPPHWYLLKYCLGCD